MATILFVFYQLVRVSEYVMRSEYSLVFSTIMFLYQWVRVSEYVMRSEYS